MQEALTVRREAHIAAPPAAVFALLTDPEKILRWMGTEADIDPQAGGLYLVNVTGARFARGAFREVVPVHRLAYSFGWEESEVVPPGSSLVEIDLIEQAGGTLLRLTHTGLPSAEQCAGHDEGWAHYLARLAVVGAGGDPGPIPGMDASATRERPQIGRGSPERLDFRDRVQIPPRCARPTFARVDERIPSRRVVRMTGQRHPGMIRAWTFPRPSPGCSTTPAPRPGLINF